jgi:hypothetical protein
MNAPPWDGVDVASLTALVTVGISLRCVERRAPVGVDTPMHLNGARRATAHPEYAWGPRTGPKTKQPNRLRRVSQAAVWHGVPIGWHNPGGHLD